MDEYEFDFETLALSPDDILHEMGYRTVKPEKEVTDILYFLLDKIAPDIRPTCTFKLLNGQANDSSVIFDNGEVFQTGSIISRLLNGAHCFAVFAATAGQAFQTFQEEVKKENDMLSIFILDTIGSYIVEKTGDIMEQLLKKKIAGYRHTHRFSPGYCGWPLMDQKHLFGMLGNTPCNITLSDVYLMNPIKSISGIIGIGANVEEKKYGCSICQSDSCYKRKI